MTCLQQMSKTSRRKRRTSPISSASTAKKRVITLINTLKTQKAVKKLVFVLATSTLVTAARKNMVKTAGTVKTTRIAETIGNAMTTKAGKDGKSGEYPKTNLPQVLYI